MAIWIRMTGESSDEDLRSFYAWLRDDEELRLSAIISMEPAAARPGDMGGATDVVQLVIGDGFQLASLAIAYLSWRATRPSQPKVTIETGGVRITLDGSDPDLVSSMMKSLKVDGSM